MQENSKVLTLEELNEAAPGSILRSGTAINSPDDIYMTDSNIGRKLLWVAKRGAINDWAIYAHWEDKGMDFVIRMGDKIRSPANIEKLVPCTDDAFERYRH